MYNYYNLDLKKYKMIDEWPSQRFEFALKEMPEEFSRLDEVRFKVKRAYNYHDQIGEKIAYETAKLMGIPCCRAELFYKGDILFNHGAVSFYELTQDDVLYSSENVMARISKRMRIPDVIASPDIDSVMFLSKAFFLEEGGNEMDYTKFRQAFINMLLFDIKLGNDDRKLCNWFFRKNKKTGKIDLYPMFDNEGILGMHEYDERFSTIDNKGDLLGSITLYDSLVTSAVCRPQDRMNRQKCTSFEMLEYVCQHYPKEVEKGLKQINRVNSSDINRIANEIPDIPEHLRKFIVANYMCREEMFNRTVMRVLTQKESDNMLRKA